MPDTTTPMRRHAALLLAAGSLCAPTLYAAAPAGVPPPGQYRIDTETTTTSRAGPATLESVQRVDGATGRVTLTQKSSLDPANVATRTAEGGGPNRWCVPASGALPPPRSMADACRNVAASATPQGSALSAQCSTGRLDEQWRRIDERTWERSLLTRQASTAPGSAAASPQAAIELAMRGMSPKQRAEAQAELAAMPSAEAMADARGTLVATLQQQALGGSPDAAAAAREQLRTMGAVGALPGGGPAGSGQGVVVRVKERWSRVADTCRAGG